MCTGAEMAMLASAVVSSAGTVAGGQAEKNMADYNARVAEQGAQAATDRAAYDETAHRAEIRRILSKQRAAYGRSGVDVSGSPLLVLEDTAMEGELDAMAIRYGGEVEAARKKSEASLLRQQGRNIRTASYFQAGSTLLTGAGRVYENRLKQAKTPSPWMSVDRD